VSTPLHGDEAAVGRIPEVAWRFIRERIERAPMGRTGAPEELREALRGSISPTGLGSDDAWRRFADVVVPNTIGLDSERFLAFIPVSPAAAAVWMDTVVCAASFSAESWLEGAGAVAAENQVLRWLADLAGLPASAGGCFMSGGSIGNLSALAVARERAGGDRGVIVADSAHASVGNALRLLALDPVVVGTGPSGRLEGPAVAAALRLRPDARIVVASGGSTNGGIVDDLEGAADAAQAVGAWLHVDAAYGGAALLLDERRRLFAGIERADSLIVDPHKWLFSTSGSCALLYREPRAAADVHTQHGPYLDVLRSDSDEWWNPSDYGFQLTRRASGLPLWFTLAVHGTDAMTAAVRRGLELTAYAAAKLRSAGPHVEVLLEPELSVLLFRREGWDRGAWRAWADRLLREGTAVVAPTTWRGEPVGRLVFMHPRTPESLVDEVVATLN
jgi:aromatic-L-amino-acid/L-tryptophan decarboxylase